ncbi:MAG: hypothetical protein LBB80_10710 [Treponema sp.]|jgi:hypothetical protein|nr:hypothetical protein [Treponema sp.]
MQENIRIPEVLIVVFLVLPAIRPYIRGLQSQDGLVWFPLVALAMGIALFPAYGFRPECVPLLLCTVFLNIRHIPLVLDHLGWWDRDTVPRQGFTRVRVGFLILTAAVALYFFPRQDTRLTFQGVQTRTIRDEGRNVDIFLRLYGPADPDTQSGASPARPLMLLVPPVFGSVGMVDQVCRKLRDQGFTVLSFSRRDFDFPAWGPDGKQYSPPVQEQFHIFQAFAQGSATEAANLMGRALETGRMEDIRFLLSYIKQNLYMDFPESEAEQNTLFLAGYDAGGSALALLGASPEWRAANPEVKGLILVESPLWSVYQFDEPKSPPQIKPLIRPQVPSLFMTSDRISDPKKRDRPYGPLLQILQTDIPAVLAAVDGAGPLDYSDCPAKYPLYSACISGNKQTPWKYDTFIEGTASIMTNFASLLLENAPPDPTRPPVALSRRKGLGGTIHFETGRAWNLPDFGYILSP